LKDYQAVLSLDLDDKWTYLRTHGSPRWQDYPTYLPEVVPVILDFLRRHEQKITFFVVGKDAAAPGATDCLGAIAAEGHDIANHSFNHEPWLHLLSREDLVREIGTAEEAIFRVTGHETSGFRGPGYSISRTHLDVLAERRYRYDASAFPNILNPVARAYFFARSDLSEDEKEQRKMLFGNFSDALRPIVPFVWQLSSRRLLEIPVTTMPLFRLPCHFSYVLYLSGFSRWLGYLYFRLAMWICRRTGASPSLLLHPLDFLGPEDETDLAFFPGMNLSRSHKLAVLGRCMDYLQQHFGVATMAQYATKIVESGQYLRSYVPNLKK
jgi:hypothetical protein